MKDGEHEAIDDEAGERAARQRAAGSRWCRQALRFEAPPAAFSTLGMALLELAGSDAFQGADPGAREAAAEALAMLDRIRVVLEANAGTPARLH